MRGLSQGWWLSEQTWQKAQKLATTNKYVDC